MSAAAGGSDPGRGGDGGKDEDASRNPRVPKNLKGLLQMSIAASAANSGSNSENVGFQSMSEERKQWLENAIDCMTVSPVQRMKDCIAKLQDHSKEDDDVLDKKTQALEELIEWCENIDCAMDYHKIGGFELFPTLLEDNEPEIRWKSLELIATLVQNIPYCQEAAIKQDLIPIILQRLDTDCNGTVRVKALYAMSCLTRDVPEAQALFVQHDGFSILMRAMQSDVEKLKIKAAFMLSHLCRSEPKFKDTLCDMGMIDQLTGHLNEEHTAFHEHLMGALLSIVRDHPRCIDELSRTELDLHTVLKHRINFLKEKDAFQEEKEYATELLNILQQADSSSMEEAQR